MLRQSQHRRSQSGILDPGTNTYFSRRWGNLVIKLACILFTNEHFPLADLVFTGSSSNLSVEQQQILSPALIESISALLSNLPNLSSMAFLNNHSHIIHSSASSVNQPHHLLNLSCSPYYYICASWKTYRHMASLTVQFWVRDSLHEPLWPLA